jgi:hypothetical protein
MSLGYSQAEVAAALGMRQPIVSARLADLRDELSANEGEVPGARVQPPTENEYVWRYNNRDDGEAL